MLPKSIFVQDESNRLSTSSSGTPKKRRRRLSKRFLQHASKAPKDKPTSSTHNRPCQISEFIVPIEFPPLPVWSHADEMPNLIPDPDTKYIARVQAAQVLDIPRPIESSTEPSPRTSASYNTQATSIDYVTPPPRGSSLPKARTELRYQDDGRRNGMYLDRDSSVIVAVQQPLARETRAQDVDDTLYMEPKEEWLEHKVSGEGINVVVDEESIAMIRPIQLVPERHPVYVQPVQKPVRAKNFYMVHTVEENNKTNEETKYVEEEEKEEDDEDSLNLSSPGDSTYSSAIMPPCLQAPHPTTKHIAVEEDDFYSLPSSKPSSENPIHSKYPTRHVTAESTTGSLNLIHPFTISPIGTSDENIARVGNSTRPQNQNFKQMSRIPRPCSSHTPFSDKKSPTTNYLKFSNPPFQKTTSEGKSVRFEDVDAQDEEKGTEVEDSVIWGEEVEREEKKREGKNSLGRRVKRVLFPGLDRDV
ncbi:hypothetical protein BDV96DRAFT_669421 [Lophiotrema nucula]|uniref:Uncharacterized protein n=1 Tax=Lophiotrema nucula TaxID=690887 RepID=A0A6A5YRV4_9PLEO|nr:hypothetical protein BDV96DRAFT_669421 [Lophiotrema nucula]